ncbi:GTP-binding protein [Thiomicrorhabdus sp. zzn3]|uniref:CobW family GTP-binding protein n=1 Tax=Thiomicrorhabdus sp. zzn3 TaxID=3039775 RepID=UPI002436DE88|nr:GTP-binding protein [Thiomicrorhabdus sp. zzn3]MDG6777150.1 GTP-binding protein [Thiomicrorhabdus sp. zzn3]
MPGPLPVHLITGLLGSGKTTTLQHLIKQKPADERWGLLINEFGDIDIDAATVKSQHPDMEVVEVSGGCLCCTAQFTLQQAIERLASLSPELDRLWIEPTGLGHPAKVLDVLKQKSFSRTLAVQAVIGVITPMQLTPERWQKSAVMRDLMHLAEIILVNKTDQASPAQTEQACRFLQTLYPPKKAILPLNFGQVSLTDVQQAHQPAPFILLHGLDTHLNQLQTRTVTYPSTLPGIESCQATYSGSNQNAAVANLNALGWRFSSEIPFNRVQLKTFFQQLAPQLQRAKGLLKTGKEWQLINWSDDQLTFEEIAWRADSRLELIFKTGPVVSLSNKTQNPINNIEIQLLSCLNLS